MDNERHAPDAEPGARDHRTINRKAHRAAAELSQALQAAQREGLRVSLRVTAANGYTATIRGALQVVPELAKVERFDPPAGKR